MGAQSRAKSNFNRAVLRLENFVATPNRVELTKAAIIQAFEFTFESSWKALQSHHADVGLRCTNPRQCISEAIRAGLIPLEKEGAWLQMMQDRNLTSHVYSVSLSDIIVDRISKEHLENFLALNKELSIAPSI